MKCRFVEKIFKQGNRYFIEIPFNVWEEFGQKGMISVKVSIEDYPFECRLIPKGEGIYYIPVAKKIADQIKDVVSVSLEVISGLTRINHDSPYTKENPIRKINSIESVSYPKDGYCGQICIAMLTGLSVDEVINIMQTKAWQCSFTKLIETLDYFGIQHNKKITYTKGKEFTLPECCIVNIKDENTSHFVLYYKGKYYDTKSIVLSKIIGYLEIII
ncbi:DUF1905 domain-containing protein [Candidatus Stoquefichus sp. SB1]|uniref:DUF1905 domain-containing protein n=1 Tax=Candidatus Stoquefichus sp. SB1 TaxID=1658109 RepID=UPI00067F7109|nr:DUF1905 domain-containing protein [Candidatus Stoquefichus sp. SB1]